MSLLRPLDPAFPIERQLAVEASPVVLVNVFTLDKADEQTFLKAWQDDAVFMKRQPGFISTQLHRAIGESPTAPTGPQASKSVRGVIGHQLNLTKMQLSAKRELRYFPATLSRSLAAERSQVRRFLQANAEVLGFGEAPERQAQRLMRAAEKYDAGVVFGEAEAVTGVINQIRAFLLERGVAVRQGLRFLRAGLPQILATRTDVLSPRMVHVIEALAGDWRRLDERIEGLSADIETLVQHDPACQRLMTVPGIGPIISSAMVAAIGRGEVFSKGRDFGAWLGLVPKQTSTGDRTILGRISKRGNRYLRVLFVQAAWVVLIRPKSWERYGLKPWIEAAKKRLHRNVLAIALANKLARIAWSVLAHGRNFEVRKIDEAAAQSV